MEYNTYACVIASAPFEPLWYPYPPPLSGAPTGTLRFAPVRAGVESADPVQRRHRRSCIEAPWRRAPWRRAAGGGRRAATDRPYPVGLAAPKPGPAAPRVLACSRATRANTQVP